MAIGATIQASMIVLQNKGGLLLDDVTPFSLGIELNDESMSIVIHHNSSVGCSETQTYYTPEDNTVSIGISVYQGENEIAKDNTFLGRFTLSGITPGPRGQEIEVTFTVNFVSEN